MLLMKDVMIIDKAVPTSIHDVLETIALGDKINWFRQKRATYAEGTPAIFPVTPDSLDVQQFTHTIYEENQPVSKLFGAILPVITAIPYTIKQMIRIKMNLCVYAQTDNPNAHGMPHVDFTEIKEPIISAIYFVNDSTGDTVIFDQRFGQSAPLTVKTRVTPKKGRLVVFDGGLLHAGNTPKTNAPRININFNAFVYEGAHTL
jgi:hypothetical protein